MADIDGDVLVVGSGPAGVCAAFPLLGAGTRVVMVDGGEAPDRALPQGEYLALRRGDPAQSEWMLGGEGAPLRTPGGAASPKFRVPTLDFAFRGFAHANRIDAEAFALVGSLATGGLSNAWGCGVARFAAAEWAGLDVEASEWDRAFAAVAQRIGISGRADDDLSALFGIDAHAQPPLPLDALHRSLDQRYQARRGVSSDAGFRLGRARVAVLTEEGREGRQACDLRGLCLWGCPRAAMYSSRHEVAAMARHAHFVHRPGHVVERLVPAPGGWRAEITRRDGTPTSIHCTRVVLAAGTLASTAIVMRSLAGFDVARLLHVPTAAFALGLPAHLGRAAEPGVAFAQLAYSLSLDAPDDVFGYTFSTHGIPVAEFVRHAPLSRAGGVRVFREVLTSMIVANCFLPSRFSATRMHLRDDGRVRIEGAEHADIAAFADRVRARLAQNFRRLGAHVLPGSFRRGAIGSDVHYAATMPMRNVPSAAEAGIDGGIAGLPGVHVVDGAVLPSLPAKSHTLAIMANAHRIATRLAAARVR